MRGAFVRALTKLAASDNKHVLLTGDLGWSVFEEFRQRFPTRFFNVGVAEQNMIGMAIGLAEAGYIPWCYSIGTFATMRGYEFIRAAAMNGAPIRIVGMGAGFEYGTAGPTHFALEDIALMRALPDVTVIAPCDHEQAFNAVLATGNGRGKSNVIYYRLGKDDISVVPHLNGCYDPDGPIWLNWNTSDILVLSTGAISIDVAGAIGRVEREHETNIDFGIVSRFDRHAKKLDLGERNDLAYRAILTVEEHGKNGGLGSLVAEQIAEGDKGIWLIRRGVEGDYLAGGQGGSTAWWRKKHLLDVPSLVGEIEGILNTLEGRG